MKKALLVLTMILTTASVAHADISACVADVKEEVVAFRPVEVAERICETNRRSVIECAKDIKSDMFGLYKFENAIHYCSISTNQARCGSENKYRFKSSGPIESYAIAFRECGK